MAELHFFVGSYDRAGGLGLYPIVRTAEGRWEIGPPWSGARNASFGVYSPRHDIHYLVDEMAGSIAACRVIDGAWTVLGRIDSGGKEPCHLALDRDQTRLVCANYGDGTATIFRLDPGNGLPSLETSHPNRGHGADSERQEGPHAHWVGYAPGGRWLYQTDLGTDEIRAFSVDGAVGDPQRAWQAPAGGGPRHLAFAPAGDRAWLVSELASTLTVLKAGDGELSAVATLSTLPEGHAGENLGGHIGLNRAGDRLYVTNRGHDSVAVFACETDGALTLLQHVPTGGASPRFFLLLEEQGEMLVANEEGDSVTVLQIAADGTLADTGVRLAVPGPVFISTA